MSAPSDIMMMYSVTDVQGLNSISRQVLANARPRAGRHDRGKPAARKRAKPRRRLARPAVGLTMFGVTTPACRRSRDALERDFECLVFHATGAGGRSMEKLVDSGLLAGVIDLTTTEVADMLVGGVLPADEDRFGAVDPHRACPMSARSARSTWSISGRATRCPSGSAAAGS